MAVTNTTVPSMATLSDVKASWTPYVVSFFLLYSLLCSILRFWRRDAMHKKFNFTTKESFSKMTNVEAYYIIKYLTQLEFPRFYELSLQFALFKTYGIPTISGLLVATKEFSTPTNASKRYADTTLLIVEFTSHHPHSERAIKALARMNYIHSQYQRAGKISNQDLLYTLSVFIREPVRWIKQYEWRHLTDMEICAIATLWKSIGDAMGIKYDGLLAHSEWADGLDFYHDIDEWATQYEEDYMVPHSANKQTADELVPLLLFFVPQMLRGPAAHLVGVLMGDRLRQAMIYPTPPSIYFSIASVMLRTRRFLLRHLSPPRPGFLRVLKLSDEADSNGRFFMKDYQAHPFYVKPGFLNVWGPEGWLVWLSGGDVPGSNGDEYLPRGYKFEEVGPKAMRGKGTDVSQAWEERVKADRPLGCPFALP